MRKVVAHMIWDGDKCLHSYVMPDRVREVACEFAKQLGRSVWVSPVTEGIATDPSPEGFTVGTDPKKR